MLETFVLESWSYLCGISVENHWVEVAASIVPTKMAIVVKSKNNTCSYLMRSSVVNWGVVLPWRTSFWSWSVWFRAKMTCMQDHAIVQRKKQVHKLKVSNKGEKGEPGHTWVTWLPGHTWGRLEAGTALPPSPQRPPECSLKKLLWSFKEMWQPFSSAWLPSEPSRGPRQGNLCWQCLP